MLPPTSSCLALLALALSTLALNDAPSPLATITARTPLEARAAASTATPLPLTQMTYAYEDVPYQVKLVLSLSRLGGMEKNP